MVIASHVLATAILAHFMHLEGGELATAYVFGVAVDLDHFYGIPALIKQKTISFKNTHFNHYYPVGHSLYLLPVILAVCWWQQSLVAAIFWLLHLFLDSLQRGTMYLLWPLSRRIYKGELIPLESKPEWIISVLGLIGWFGWRLL